MDWLLFLRLFDLILIGLSVGFTIALYWRVDHYVRATRHLRVARLVYLVSYAFLAVGAMAEVEYAIKDGRAASWRTLVLTVAALTSSVASGWCWKHWATISAEMKLNWLARPKAGTL
jgi:hypothetical protein